MGHNSTTAETEQERARILAGFDEIYNFDKTIDDLKELHIDPVAALRTQAWRSLKTDTAIERADLKIGYELYKRNREAEDLEAEADGERVQDNLRRVFAALSEGETLDWLAALNEMPPAKPMTDADAYDLGLQAGRAGKPKLDCPDFEKPSHTDQWITGWERGTLAKGASDNANQEAAAPPQTDEIKGPDTEWGEGGAPAMNDPQLDGAGEFYNAGKSAGFDKKPLSANPYDGRSLSGKMWRRGHDAALKDMARSADVEKAKAEQKVEPAPADDSETDEDAMFSEANA